MRRLTIVVLALAGILGLQAADWPVFGHDPWRSGVDPEQALTRGNVSGLRQRWRAELGDVADSAPIVVGSMLYATAKDGTTYGIDAASGRIAWRFATHGPKITTATPAYDAQTRSLYAGGVDGAIHRLDPQTGHERRGGGFPARITTAPQTEKDASSLNVANGYVYAQISGYIGDATPYVGHIVAVRLSDGARRVFNTLCSDRHALIEPQTCSEQRSGMWSRAGVVVDPDPAMGGRIYGTTGNGAFDAARGGHDYGDSVIALAPDASRLLGSFTPSNFAELDSSDQDLGSTSPALLPRQSQSATPLMAVQGGKDDVLRLLDRARLGGLGHALQTVDLGAGIYTAPAVWTDPRGTTWIFVGVAESVHALRLVTENRRSRLVPAWSAAVKPTEQSFEGSSPVVSNGVVFSANDGELVALDATNGRRLWMGAIGPIHWESPVVANGTVYCADEDGHLTAFGLR